MFGAVVLKPVSYSEGDQQLEGWIAFDDASKDKKPGVVVVHDWYGVGDYVKARATQLAEMGYVAFVADIYGKGQTPKDDKQAAELATKFRSGDRKQLRARIRAAVDVFKKAEQVDASRIAAIGYCFGGSTVLELARSGADDVLGVVSFHGGLAVDATHAPTVPIKAKILVLHGADDPYVPPADVAKFQDEMREAKADYSLTAYADAVHGFTSKAAGEDKSKGMAYNKKADERSWRAMKDFFGEIFGTK